MVKIHRVSDLHDESAQDESGYAMYFERFYLFAPLIKEPQLAPFLA